MQQWEIAFAVQKRLARFLDDCREARVNQIKFAAVWHALGGFCFVFKKSFVGRKRQCNRKGRLKLSC